jgi:hypothetical protein
MMLLLMKTMILVDDNLICRIPVQEIELMGGWGSDALIKHYIGLKGAGAIGMLGAMGYGNCLGKDLTKVHFNIRACALIGVDRATVSKLLHLVFPFLTTLEQKVSYMSCVWLAFRMPLYCAASFQYPCTCTYIM